VGQHAAAQQRRQLWGSALVVFGLAAVHGLHGEGVPQYEGEACCGTQVGAPVPGEGTLDGHHQAVPIGRNSLEKRCRRGLHVAVEQHFAVVVQETDVHGAGVQVAPTVKSDHYPQLL
jgi:hypothetical protein